MHNHITPMDPAHQALFASLANLSAAELKARSVVLLHRLLAQPNQPWDQAQSTQFFYAVAQGAVDDAVLASALTVLKLQGEHSDVLSGAARAFRYLATPFPTPRADTFDCCGTGGDGSNTINISTTAAIVAASMGIPMVKHGNRSVSSQSGSADLLQALGIAIEQSPADAATQLAVHGFSFLFAPHYHAGVKHAMPVRQALKTRTLFNLLGPLLNPAAPQYQLLGVYDPALLPRMAETLIQLGVQRGWVVHGEGCDEIGLHGVTLVASIDQGQLRFFSLSAADFGLPQVGLNELQGGDPAHNAAASLAILHGTAPRAHQYAIAANVAAMLLIYRDLDLSQLPTLTQEVLQHLAAGHAAAYLPRLLGERHA